MFHEENLVEEPMTPIGNGAFGVVWAVIDPRDQRRLALKKIPNIFRHLTASKRVYRELRMLATLRHQNVLSLHDIVQPEDITNFNELYILTELMECDLERIIVSPQPLSGQHVKIFLYQILRGLKYLHSAGVLHRDLKPANILVNSNCCLKIGDFGLSRIYEPNEEVNMTGNIVTPSYRAPEILMGANRYDFGLDIWSVGCIFAELLGRRILFHARTAAELLKQIINVVGTPSVEDMWAGAEGARAYILRQPHRDPAHTTLCNLSPIASDEAVQLLTRMLVFNPRNRISVKDALADPYLSDGRKRFHHCMCTCCSTSPQGVRELDSNPEPESPTPFSPGIEHGLVSIECVREALRSSINLSHQQSQRTPLTFNQNSINFRTIRDAHVVAAPQFPTVP